MSAGSCQGDTLPSVPTGRRDAADKGDQDAEHRGGGAAAGQRGESVCRGQGEPGQAVGRGRQLACALGFGGWWGVCREVTCWDTWVGAPCPASFPVRSPKGPEEDGSEKTAWCPSGRGPCTSPAPHSSWWTRLQRAVWGGGGSRCALAEADPDIGHKCGGRVVTHLGGSGPWRGVGGGWRREELLLFLVTLGRRTRASLRGCGRSQSGGG